MFKTQDDKLRLMQPGLIILGIDIAKRRHWAQATYHNGILIGKPFSFKNTIEGFESLLVRIERIKQETGCKEVIVGMEPTGHYWKPLCWFLMKNNIMVVLVNPHHVKKSKELDDNTPTKSDPKDAKIIARLVRDGRFSEAYLPQGNYSELRVLTNHRTQLRAKLNGVMNLIHAILDEYFPEFLTVFKAFTGKAAMHILNKYPFPEDLKKIGVEGIEAEFKKAVKTAVGKQRAERLYQAACQSIGVPAPQAAKDQLRFCLDELNFFTRQIEEVEKAMEKQLQALGIGDYLLSIKGIGIVTAAGILGEIGDPRRFVSWKQVRKLAGFNLVEDSSGQRQGRRVISKRGRSLLRSFLYQAAIVMVAKNEHFKQLYHYLTKRKENPLKKKQALIVIATKLIRVMFALITKEEFYDPAKVLGAYREEQIKAA